MVSFKNLIGKYQSLHVMRLSIAPPPLHGLHIQGQWANDSPRRRSSRSIVTQGSGRLWPCFLGGWFQFFLIFLPQFREDFQFDEHIFSDGLKSPN